MDKNVGKRQYLPTLLSMTAKQKVIKLFKENQGLFRTAEAIRLEKKYILLYKNYKKILMHGLNTIMKTEPHSGRYCYSKTLMQTFLYGKKIASEK